MKVPVYLNAMREIPMSQIITGVRIARMNIPVEIDMSYTCVWPCMSPTVSRMRCVEVESATMPIDQLHGVSNFICGCPMPQYRTYTTRYFRSKLYVYLITSF